MANSFKIKHNISKQDIQNSRAPLEPHMNFRKYQITTVITTAV